MGNVLPLDLGKVAQKMVGRGPHAVQVQIVEPLTELRDTTRQLAGCGWRSGFRQRFGDRSHVVQTRFDSKMRNSRVALCYAVTVRGRKATTPDRLPLQPPATKSTSKSLMAGAPSKIPESSSVTTAIEVTLPPEAASLYSEVSLAMNEHHLPYAIAGAFALQKYTGIWRLTKDLDLFMKAEDIPAALEYLAQLDFRCETLDPVWLSKAHRGEYFVDLISGMSNAAVVVDDSWMQRTIPTLIAGVPSRIISVEDLLGSKSL